MKGGCFLFGANEWLGRIRPGFARLRRRTSAARPSPLGFDPATLHQRKGRLRACLFRCCGQAGTPLTSCLSIKGGDGGGTPPSPFRDSIPQLSAKQKPRIFVVGFLLYTENHSPGEWFSVYNKTRALTGPVSALVDLLSISEIQRDFAGDAGGSRFFCFPALALQGGGDLNGEAVLPIRRQPAQIEAIGRHHLDPGALTVDKDLHALISVGDLQHLRLAGEAGLVADEAGELLVGKRVVFWLCDLRGRAELRILQRRAHALREAFQHPPLGKGRRRIHVLRLALDEKQAVIRLDGQRAAVPAKSTVVPGVVDMVFAVLRQRDRSAPGLIPLVDQIEELLIPHIAHSTHAVADRGDRQRTVCGQLAQQIGKLHDFRLLLHALRQRLAGAEAVRIGVEEQRSAALARQLDHRLGGLPGDKLGIRNDQHLMTEPVHCQPVADLGLVEVPLCKHIGGDVVKVDLIVLQDAAGLLHQHGLAAPFRFAVVQDRHRAYGMAARDHTRHPVGVLHQLPEVAVLGIVALGIEVRRAVPVRILLCGEGMGHKVIDPAHHEVVQQVLLQPHALLPAVVAKDLAHRPAVHVRVQRAHGGAQLAESVVIELAVLLVTEHVLFLPILHAGLHLAADVVDAGHALPLETPEVVPQAGARAGVLVVVLHHVADVLHPMRAAPLADLMRKVLLHQAGDAVHKGVADLRRQKRIAVIRPQQRQQGGIACAQLLFQRGGQLPAPGQILLGAEKIVHLIHGVVAQLRLVREKARDHAAELIAEVLIVGLIHRVDLDAAGLLVHHVDVAAVGADVAGEVAELHLPLALRRRPVQHAVLELVRQVDGFRMSVQPDRRDAQKRIVVKLVLRRVVLVEDIRYQIHFVVRDKRRMRLLRGVQPDLPALHRKAFVQQTLPPQLIRRLLRRAGRKAGGKVLVVQDSDPHAPLLGLVQQDRHIPPPGLLTKALVGPCLHTEGADVGVIDGLHHFAVNVFALSVYPQEGQNAAVKIVGHNGMLLPGCSIWVIINPFMENYLQPFSFS